VRFTPDGARIGESFHRGAGLRRRVERTDDERTAKGVEFVAPPEKQPWGAFACT
jgi:hypothetical protein